MTINVLITTTLIFGLCLSNYLALAKKCPAKPISFPISKGKCLVKCMYLGILNALFSDGYCCKWSKWQDVDNPSGKCDCEDAQCDCDVQGWQIQLTSGGPIYSHTNPTDLPQVFDITPHKIYCWNRDQPGCKVNSQGYPVPWAQKACCQDYRVRFCCQTQQKQYR